MAKSVGSKIGEIIGQNKRDNDDIRETGFGSEQFGFTQISARDSINLLPAYVEVIKKPIGGNFILDSSVNGRLDDANYTLDADGDFVLAHPTQSILGSAYQLGDSNSAPSFPVMIFHQDNTYCEDWRTTAFQSSGSATWDTSNAVLQTAGLGTSSESSSIFLSLESNNTPQTVVSATPFATVRSLASSDSVSLYLSADGGSNWELATLNQTHNFTNTGRDLRWRWVFQSQSGTYIEKGFKIIYAVQNI